jgi:hypothetical protein
MSPPSSKMEEKSPAPYPYPNGQNQSGHTAQQNNSPPPNYTPEDQAADEAALNGALRKLKLTDNAGSKEKTTVTTDECIAHLKLLAAISDLRDSIGTTDDLFGIKDVDVNYFRTKNEDEKNQVSSQIREKRWAIYVTKAVERFTVWWQKCVPISGVGSNRGAVTLDDIERSHRFNQVTGHQVMIRWNADTMPPLGLLSFLGHIYSV